MRRLTLALAVAATSVPLAAASGWPAFGQGGASLRLPPTWSDLTTKRELLRVTGSLAKQHPRLAPYLQALSTVHGPLVKVLAVDLAPASLEHGFLTTAYVKLEPPYPSRPGWFQAVLNQVQTDPAVTHPVSHRSTRLPVGQALELRYRWRLRVTGGVYDVAVTQYAILIPGAGYMLVYWTSPAQDAAYRHIFEQSARTLRL